EPSLGTMDELCAKERGMPGQRGGRAQANLGRTHALGSVFLGGQLPIAGGGQQQRGQDSTPPPTKSFHRLGENDSSQEHLRHGRTWKAYDLCKKAVLLLPGA